MKISSNFHDYYDSMRSSDQDPDPLYVRLPKMYELVREVNGPNLNPATPEDIRQADNIRVREIFFSHYYSPGYFGRRTLNIPEWIQIRVVGFCGRLYPVMSVGNPFEKDNYKHAYTPERAIKLIQEYTTTYDRKLYPDFPKTLKMEKERMLEAMNRRYEPLERHFQFAEWRNFLQNNAVGDEAFRHFRSPVLMTDRTNGNLIPILISNPTLRNVDFVQVFTPQQAYQELSMYIGNNLAGLDRKEPRPITDKLRAETKGFDKSSFRNQKNRKTSERGDW